VERGRRRRADHVVDECGELPARRRGRGGHGDDDPRGTVLAYRRDRGAHAGSGGEAVVDEDDRAVRHLDRRPIPAVRLLAAPELPDLALAHRVERLVVNALRDVLVANGVHGVADSGDRAHRQFRLTRQPELAHDQYVEVGAEGVRDRGRDGYAAARQPQHQNGSVDLAELLGQCPARGRPIQVRPPHTAMMLVRWPHANPGERPSGARIQSPRAPGHD
jgi:hypothetical protein